MVNEWAIFGRRPIGKNSVVLNVNAAKAKSATVNQEWACVSDEMDLDIQGVFFLNSGIIEQNRGAISPSRGYAASSL